MLVPVFMNKVVKKAGDHFLSFKSQERDVFDSKKKVKATTADGLEHKLTETQQRIMEFNRCLLLFYTNQVIIVTIIILDLEYLDSDCHGNTISQLYDPD